MSLGITDDESSSVFMFELTKHNFRSLSETWSQTCNINNLIWQLRISKYIDSDDEYLSVYLYCEPSNYSELWCCTARVRLVLRSLKEGVQDYSREFVQLFSSTAGACGYPDFLRWTEVIDPNKGYVVDDVIKIQAYIDANAPRNVDPNTDDDEERPQNFKTWKALLEDDISVKIVRRISEELKELSGTVELGQKNVVHVLNDRLKKTLDSAIAPVFEKIDSLRGTLRNISTNQSTALCPMEQRMLSLLEKIEKISVDNVATLVNQFKFLNLKDGEKNVENGIMADKDKKNMKKASISDGEPILLSILKILQSTSGCMYNSDDVKSCNGYNGFSDDHPHLLRPDAERNHLSSDRFAPWGECSMGRSTPCTSRYYSTANEQHSQKKQNPLNSSCISLPHLFRKTENDLEKRKCDETESNFSGVSCCSSKLQVLKSELREKNGNNLQSFNSTEMQKKNLLSDGMGTDGEVMKTPSVYTLKELYNWQKKLEKFNVLETNET